MFSRKLCSLGFPDTTSSFEEDNQFRELVNWLEATHIRTLSGSELSKLGDTKSPEWDRHFDEYLKAIHCPHTPSASRNTIVSWLLGRAVRQAYDAKAEELKPLSAEKWESSNSSENPLVNLNYNSEVFVQLSQKLSQLLSIAPCGDHKEVLDAACMLLTDRLKTAAESVNSSAAAKRSKTEIGPERSMPLQATPLGFDTSDQILNDLAKILRLQHINELRELQTAVDETIVSVQKITANPKTDTRLGKHGF